jgi:hypothetical protein
MKNIRRDLPKFLAGVIISVSVTLPYSAYTQVEVQNNKKKVIIEEKEDGTNIFWDRAWHNKNCGAIYVLRDDNNIIVKECTASVDIEPGELHYHQPSKLEKIGDTIDVGNHIKKLVANLSLKSVTKRIDKLESKIAILKEELQKDEVSKEEYDQKILKLEEKLNISKKRLITINLKKEQEEKVANGSDFKTPESSVFVGLPADTPHTMKNINKVIDNYLYIFLREKVEDRFDQHMELAKKLKNPELNEYILKVKNELFNDQESPKKQIRKFLTLYPDLIFELQNEFGNDLKPLICRYELPKYYTGIAKKWSGHFATIGLALTASGAIAGATGNPMPALLIAGVTVGVTTSLADASILIKDKIVNAKANKTLRKLVKVDKKFDKIMDKLKKDRSGSLLSDEEVAYLESLIAEDVENGDYRPNQLRRMRKDEVIDTFAIILDLSGSVFRPLGFNQSFSNFIKSIVSIIIK